LQESPDHVIRLYVPGDHRSGGDHGSLADADTGQDGHTRSDPGPIRDCDALVLDAELGVVNQVLEVIIDTSGEIDTLLPIRMPPRMSKKQPRLMIECWPITSPRYSHA
jgi:hypothetical protein